MEKWLTERWRNLAKVDEEKARRLQSGFIVKLKERVAERELQKELDLEYRYFRWEHKTKEYLCEVSVSFGWKKIDDEIVYSFAMQSKNDRFSRKEARRYINKRFSSGSRHRFKVDKSFGMKQIPLLLVAHYNGMRLYNLEKKPDHVKYIPVYFGGTV
jgi:hypothetical protein